MSEQKTKAETVNIMDYLVSKDGKTKYLKLSSNPNLDDGTKAKIKKIRDVLGTDVLFVNLFDSEFRDKYNIPEFVKGRVSVAKNTEEEAAPAPTTKAKGKSKPSADDDGDVDF